MPTLDPITPSSHPRPPPLSIAPCAVDQQHTSHRMVTGAPPAPTHPVNWTAEIISPPPLQLALHRKWGGLAGHWHYKHSGHISKSEVISGIPGSPKAPFGVH